MSQPLVSMIVPCYRQAHFLAGALRCALTQTYPALEIIVVNDGSDDETEQVAGEFGDRIRYIHQENQGLPAARNSGIAAATGEYLHYFDADDLLHPSAVAWLVEAMDGRHDRMIVMGHRLFETSPQEEGARECMPGVHRKALPDLLHGNFGPPHSYLCSRDAVNRVGGFAPLRSCEDWDLWIRLALDGAELVPLRRVGAYYRQSAGSMSTHTVRMVQCRAEVLLRAQSIILSSERLTRAYGEDLLYAELEILRCLIAQRADPRLTRELFEATRALQRRGCTTTRSPLRKWADRILGCAAERLTLAYCRCFRRQRYDDYRLSYKGRSDRFVG